MFEVAEIWNDSVDVGYRYFMAISVNESKTELVDVVIIPDDSNFWYFLDAYGVENPSIYNKMSGDFIRKVTDDEYEKLCDYIDGILRKVGDEYDNDIAM